MHARIKIMHTFCNVLIYLKSLPSSIAPLMLCSYVYISSKILISILSHLHVYETSLTLQAQGVRRAWVGDYDTLLHHCKI